MVRGVLIQHGSPLKKIRADDIRRLLSTIAELEPLHKRDLDPTIFVQLSNACRDLLQLLDSHSLTARDRARNHYYSLEKNCGKHLARALHPRPPHHSIPFITQPNQDKTFNTSGISISFDNIIHNFTTYRVQSRTPRTFPLATICVITLQKQRYPPLIH